MNLSSMFTILPMTNSRWLLLDAVMYAAGGTSGPKSPRTWRAFMRGY